MSHDGTETATSEFDFGTEDRHELHGAIFGEPIGDVPRRPLQTVEVSATVMEAVALMKDQHIGCVLVVREGKLAGIFTERDVLHKVACTAIDPKTTPVEAVMTANPQTLPASASLAYALRAMTRRGFRHIPLADESGRPMGVVAVRDIVRWLVDLFPPGAFELPPASGYPKQTDGG